MPASNNVWQYVMSDGPYKIQSYSPGKSILFVRNPTWKQSVDPIRNAYVDQIKVSETGNQQGIYQQSPDQLAAGRTCSGTCSCPNRTSPA